MIYEPLTKLECCPTSDGSAAAILASEKFVIDHGLQEKVALIRSTSNHYIMLLCTVWITYDKIDQNLQAVEILGIEMATDVPSTFKEKSMMKMVGYDMTKNAASKVFEKTKQNVEDVDVVELHDCFSANELITYEALGLCPEGKVCDIAMRRYLFSFNDIIL